MPVYSEEASTV